VRIAYLTNQYPAASHSFIRREIAAVEAEGIEVSRYSIRPADSSQLPDPRDGAELAKTTFLLHGNHPSLAASALFAIASKPLTAMKALRLAFIRCEWRPLEAIRRLAYFAEAAFLARRIRAENAGHIHAHFGTNPTTVARIASLLSGLPYSFTVHGPDEFDAPRYLDLSGKVRDCAFCVTISSYGRSQVMRWSRVEDWPKVKIVRCGVDESFLANDNQSEQSFSSQFCAVARLSPQKGIPLLIEAAAEVKRRGREFRLILVGDGELRKEIAAIIADDKIADVVELVGWADSDAVIAHLQSSRAMVLPSFAEGLPVVIMEALSLRRPVIVTAIAGTPELVDETCGWLVPAGSVAELVAAMEEALDASPEHLAQLGETGRNRVLALHDSRRNGRQLAAMFRTRGALGD
jgi:glycosyltransferase involved in cell wall biosynthesis